MTEAVAKLCLSCGKPVAGKGNRCVPCEKDEKKKARRREARRRQAALDQIERNAVDTLIRRAGDGGSTIPHSAELTEQLMTYFGGVNGFASMFVKQYHEAPPGGSMRTRMLETMTRLVTKNTDQGGAQKPVSLLSDEELEAQLEARVQALAAEVARRRIIDGTIEEAPALPASSGPPDGSAGGFVSAPAADGAPGGVGEQALRVPENLPADRAPGGVPSVHGA